MEVVKRGSLDEVRIILSEKDYEHALIIAAEYGYQDIVEWLLNYVEPTCDSLIGATKSGKLSVVKLILNHGKLVQNPDTNKRDVDGLTILIQKSKPGTFTRLGCKVAMETAIRKGYLDIVQHFCSLGLLVGSNFMNIAKGFNQTHIIEYFNFIKD